MHHSVWKSPKCRIWIFEFWHFPPIFVLLKLTCLVTLFDRKLQVFKNSPKWTIFKHCGFLSLCYRRYIWAKDRGAKEGGGRETDKTIIFSSHTSLRGLRALCYACPISRVWSILSLMSRCPWQHFSRCYWLQILHTYGSVLLFQLTEKLFRCQK